MLLLTCKQIQWQNSGNKINLNSIKKEKTDINNIQFVSTQHLVSLNRIFTARHLELIINKVSIQRQYGKIIISFFSPYLGFGWIIKF